ncbi:aspartyl-tRNA(Asn)/glutamyl-tRNA(Gln) amidotransferase subunit A [Nitrospirillum amazonense]|uniref:Aspartyl-tRNA(Asn)/glutamyl-tRNA(Gln) amidotransferase subunit A n=1 Tax=Nitrospirillum amazonense TaxID=28077 RepID=A0A560F0W5_9PROT|nr:amidase [Nitrospirillum amazonense]TWB15237.1 aspartyl-tRNA(Asn)/glutamyl-tRNA(Gln) amidotransferase subunit A [Nitrospirillum amazonense]
MTNLADLTATALSDAFAAGALSPVEVMEAVLDRVDRLEPLLHATYALDGDGALAAARLSEERWRKGAALGPLDGLPVTLKELIATRGVPKPMGTAAVELTPQPEDAPITARLREAGAIAFTKTTVPDYGMLSSGLSSFHPLTRNPWDLSRNPGGSSAGAGAAAAAGYGPLHVGTDIGGSVRLPAGWCGVFGFKPNNGRIPIDPPYMGRSAGPMTRTVDDAALLMTVISRPDARDFMSLPPADLPWRDLAGDVRGLRFGLMLDAGCGSPTEPEVAEAVTAAARLFEQAGAVVEPMTPFVTPEMFDGFDHFFRMRFWAETKDLPQDRYRKILPYIRAWVEPAAAYDAMTVYSGFSGLMAIREQGVRASQAYDYILSPVAPMPAFAAELPSPNNDPARPFDHIGFTMPYNMTEQPASSINCGYTSGGLPIGLQIVGRRFDDMGVLRVSRWFEEARGPQRPWSELAELLEGSSQGRGS